jgi:predicted phage terminase large subunit-like protein
MTAPFLIQPQPGPQTMALQSCADILLFGGGAGGGKSFFLLLDPLYEYNNPRFNSVVFRRNTTQVRNPGGLWDDSFEVYSKINGHPREASLQWEMPSGMGVKFAHLENEKTVYDWQGAQVPHIGFDELTHFTEKQFWYMLSRNRSMSGVPGRIRATCNPDCDSWVRSLVDWWIDEEGYPIPERSGMLRYFIRVEDTLIWADTKQELTDKYGKEFMPKSFTFIPSKIDDNKILLEKDPSYLSNLLALNRVDRMRLRFGNWNVRPVAGMLFRREWFPIVDAIPSGWISAVRFWDRAATEPSETNPDPDWTRGGLLYKYPNGTFVFADMRSIQATPGVVEDLIKNTAAFDTQAVRIKSQQDPGSAGVHEAEYFIRMLAGYDVRVETMPKDKVTRAKPVSAQCEAGNVKVLRAPWNKEFFSELESFPEGAHDDQVDVLSGAFNELCGGLSIADVL